jgi:integrase
MLRIEPHSLKMRKAILSADQAKALLKATNDSAFDLLPYHVLCLFAGIRPKEAERLDWSNIHLAQRERFIEVPEEKSKTAMRRIVDMEPLLVRSLKYYIKRGGAHKGPVTPLFNLRKRLRAVRKAAGIERWPQDAPRRTYASCWLAIHNDVNRLNNLMGHTSPDMLWKHYHQAVTGKQARQFWRIAPPKFEEQIARAHADPASSRRSGVVNSFQ